LLPGKGTIGLDRRLARPGLPESFDPRAVPSWGRPRTPAQCPPGEPRTPQNVRPAWHGAAVRPALRAGLALLWRDRDTIQIGVDPRRAAAFTGVRRAVVMFELLDGSRDRAQVIAEAAKLGVPGATAEKLLTLLAAAGALVDYPAWSLDAVPRELRRLLGPELAAASLAGLDGDGGGQLLARRSATRVVVCGTGRLPAAIAEVLTSAGVAAACGPLTGADARPPGHEQARRADLVVLVGAHPPEPVILLRRSGVPHLAVSAAEAIGVVGPLVRPGVTGCLRCVELTRSDRDPSWPLVLAQLSARRPDPAACDAVLTLAATAQAAAQVLHFIDRPGVPGPAENATLELVQPGWQWRRRSWPPHPACICRPSAAA
jgi:bacteriocin biosynthesis cyclodehydratase domain-containing protein